MSASAAKMSLQKKTAWIIVTLVLSAVLAWTAVALHDAAVASVRAASQQSAPGSACPFTKTAAANGTEKHCCHGSETKENCDATASPATAAPFDLASFKRLEDCKDSDEFWAQFTSETIEACPHLQETLRASKLLKSKNGRK